MLMIQGYFRGTDMELREHNFVVSPHNLHQQVDFWQKGIFHLLS